MSADLLRRAALHLRALSEAGCGAPWDVHVADWLDGVASDIDRGADVPRYAAISVARAVLREPEGGDRT